MKPTKLKGLVEIALGESVYPVSEISKYISKLRAGSFSIKKIKSYLQENDDLVVDFERLGINVSGRQANIIYVSGSDLDRLLLGLGANLTREQFVEEAEKQEQISRYGRFS